MNNTRVSLLQEKDLNWAVDVFLDAFREEAFTRSLLDLSHQKSRAIYFQAIRYKLSLYLEVGHQAYGAFENSSLLGMFILRSPHVKIPFGLHLRRLLPNLPAFAWLMPQFIKATHLSTAVQPPGNLPKKHYSLEGLAVHPDHQGKGIGRLLLEKADQVCSADSSASGIYLYTGDKKNKELYQHLNYRILESKSTPYFTAYHLFKENLHNNTAEKPRPKHEKL